MEPTESPHPEDPRRALGRLGEQIAAEHLERLGYTIAARNARTRYGEIDLIALGNGALVFAEVKTRRRATKRAAARNPERPATDPYEEPLAWLRASQRLRIRRLARAWLSEHAGYRPGLDAIRFDAIGVLLDGDGRLLRLDHIEDAW